MCSVYRSNMYIRDKFIHAQILFLPPLLNSRLQLEGGLRDSSAMFICFVNWQLGGHEVKVPGGAGVHVTAEFSRAENCVCAQGSTSGYR